MTAPVLEEFDEMVLEVEITPASGTYTVICGMSGVQISRTATVETDRSPGDCTDESVLDTLTKRVVATETVATATGKWAKTSQDFMKNWFYGGDTLNVRLRDTAAATGEVETESGPAFLTQLNNERVKGQAVSAEIEIQFKTKPTLTDAS